MQAPRILRVLLRGWMSFIIAHLLQTSFRTSLCYTECARSMMAFLCLGPPLKQSSASLLALNLQVLGNFLYSGTAFNLVNHNEHSQPCHQPPPSQFPSSSSAAATPSTPQTAPYNHSSSSYKPSKGVAWPGIENHKLPDPSVAEDEPENGEADAIARRERVADWREDQENIQKRATGF